MASTWPKDGSLPKFMFFSDFDGTISAEDSLCWLIDNYGLGKEARIRQTQEVVDGRMTDRDSNQRHYENLHLSANKSRKLLIEHTVIDPYFAPLYLFCKEKNIPFTILSSGFDYFIKDILSNNMSQSGLDPATDLDIISNRLELRPGKGYDDENGWTIGFRDDSVHGHDKRTSIRPWRTKGEVGKDRPIIFYAGDGTSDISVAKEVDVLFAKKGQPLTAYCKNEKIRYIEYNSFADIQRVVEDIVLAGKSVQEAMGKDTMMPESTSQTS